MEKALYYAPMRVLVDRKLKKDIVENLIYSFRTDILRSFLGSNDENFDDYSDSF